MSNIRDSYRQLRGEQSISQYWTTVIMVSAPFVLILTIFAQYFKLKRLEAFLLSSSMVGLALLFPYAWQRGLHIYWAFGLGILLLPTMGLLIKRLLNPLQVKEEVPQRHIAKENVSAQSLVVEEKFNEPEKAEKEKVIEMHSVEPAKQIEEIPGLENITEEYSGISEEIGKIEKHADQVTETEEIVVVETVKEVEDEERTMVEELEEVEKEDDDEEDEQSLDKIQPKEIDEGAIEVPSEEIYLEVAVVKEKVEFEDLEVELEAGFNLEELINKGFQAKEQGKFHLASEWFLLALEEEPTPDIEFYLLVDIYKYWKNGNSPQEALDKVTPYLLEYMAKAPSQWTTELKEWIRNEKLPIYFEEL
ncbi:MAG: hypothetical protein GX958_08730 [Desulfitobacterium sp.]|nr:hypothetical protein [Desulfitobacterium sp.]